MRHGVSLRPYGRLVLKRARMPRQAILIGQPTELYRGAGRRRGRCQMNEIKLGTLDIQQRILQLGFILEGQQTRRVVEHVELRPRVISAPFGRERDVAVRFDPSPGKGSHGALYYGGHRTMLKDLREEISPGLLRDMLVQLGLTRRDRE